MNDETNKAIRETAEPSVSTSEFGSGVVVCLAKFSEHLWNESAVRIHRTARWAELTPEQLAAERAESETFPQGDAARRRMDAESSLRIYGTPEQALSGQIEMWMNGASDHFYELDEAKAPPPLRELAALALRIGHGFTGEQWTLEHVERIRELWKESCLAVDAQLGVAADWGEW